MADLKISKTAAPSTYTFQLGTNKWKAISFNPAFVAKAIMGEVYQVKITHGEYSGQDQFTLEAIAPHDDPNVTSDAFLPSLNLAKIKSDFIIHE